MGVWQDDHGTIYFTQIFVRIEPKTEEAQVPASQIMPSLGLLVVPKTPS